VHQANESHVLDVPFQRVSFHEPVVVLIPSIEARHFLLAIESDIMGMNRAICVYVNESEEIRNCPQDIRAQEFISVIIPNQFHSPVIVVILSSEARGLLLVRNGGLESRMGVKPLACGAML
jgi:hypothetical protein